jgi:hypothetical protein
MGARVTGAERAPLRDGKAVEVDQEERPAHHMVHH